MFLSTGVELKMSSAVNLSCDERKRINTFDKKIIKSASPISRVIKEENKKEQQ